MARDNAGKGGMLASIKHLSKRIVASYILDWVLIIAVVCAGGGLSTGEGNRHAFSLTDPAISFPHHPDTVPSLVLFLVSIVAPGILIFLVCMLFVPGTIIGRGTSAALKWRRKIWEWNIGWMGLGMAIAGTLFFTESLKMLAGKPRPDFLARCDPDLSLISQYTLSGLGAQIADAPTVVDYRICRNQSRTVTKDGFAAWPSGHASISWAGMLYLTLFLCAKFSISIPSVTSRAPARDRNNTSLQPYQLSGDDEKPLRNQSAAAPVYLLILAFIPIGTAFFISATRYIDYRHAGFDIIFGALLGAFFAWFGFHWYHIPIRTGAGWSWGARSRNRAFYIGFDVPGYVGEEGWDSGKAAVIQQPDVERQGGGTDDQPSWPQHTQAISPSPSKEQLPSKTQTDVDTEKGGSNSSTESETKFSSSSDHTV